MVVSLRGEDARWNKIGTATQKRNHAGAQWAAFHLQVRGDRVLESPAASFRVQQPASDAHAGSHLAGEMLLAQLLLAALAAPDRGGIEST